MANNRLTLVDGSGNRIGLAKYFPSQGWYNADPNLLDNLNYFLQNVDLSGCDPNDGDVGFRLEVESRPDDEEVAQVIAKSVLEGLRKSGVSL